MGQEKIVGRNREIAILDQIWNSKEAEFLAIYGRRRVGKTHLIREYFSAKPAIYFEITGEKDGSMKTQLENFMQIFSKVFFQGLPLSPPSSWKKAFELLTLEIEKNSKDIILFFDELPWLSTKRSGMLQALDYYWNRFWSSCPKITLIVCGSAASWMLDHLINAKGGLHNRLTKTILLKPYNLKGAAEFLISRGVRLSPKQMVDVYMVFGGIPYYLKQVDKGKSALQIVNKVCFQSDGLLYDEFNRLFRSLFENATDHLLIIRAIAKQRLGISRKDLIKESKIASGGTLNKRLRELSSAGFIQEYVPYGRKVKDQYYRIIDEYCYFYLYWIEPYKNKGLEIKDYWITKGQTSAVIASFGYSFETVCLKHVDEIRQSLDLEAIACEVGSLRIISKKSQEEGAQIDLLFDRQDGVVTLCEIKYSEKPFALDKAEAKNILNKIDAFERVFPKKKQISVALITLSGIKTSAWSEELIQQVVAIEDLCIFK